MLETLGGYLKLFLTSDFWLYFVNRFFILIHARRFQTSCLPFCYSDKMGGSVRLDMMYFAWGAITYNFKECGFITLGGVFGCTLIYCGELVVSNLMYILIM